MKEGLVEALLRNILGILPIIGDAFRHGENSPLVPKNQFLERLAISVLCCGHQRGVRVFVDNCSGKRFHESVPFPQPRHKASETISARAKSRIEWTQKSSSDAARGECDTSRERIEVSWLHSCLHGVSWMGVGVTLTNSRRGFHSPGKRRTLLKKQSECQSLHSVNIDWKLLAGREIGRFTAATARADGTSIRQSVGTPSTGLDEPAAVIRAQWKGDMRHITFLAMGGYFPMLRLPSRGATHCLAEARTTRGLNPVLWRMPPDAQQRRNCGAMATPPILS